MDWKNYSVEPEDGMFEKIQRTVRRRRAWRIGGMTAVVLVVAGVVFWMLTDRQDKVDSTMQVVVEENTQADTPAIASTNSTVEVAKVCHKGNVKTTEKPSKEKVATESQAVAKVNEPAATLNDEPQSLAPQGEEWHPAAKTAAVAPQTTQTAQPTQTASTPKGSTPAPVPPHYDNLLWAPNVISPADPDDKNHTFKLTSTSAVTEFHLYIFNRGGRKVYHSDNIMNTWDGTYDGKPLPQGAYVWVATFRDSDGMPHREQGTVTVLR
ncbi:MAG: gliding motility-associated C-terminal domain-containing protein [Bacteroidales bacterium]|nr:gliding motility-associated C-terminal domain-containing protein [Bacteroidales bacterium]